MAREAALKEKAGEATRTPDIFLGKEVLYQLSYTRVSERSLSCSQWAGFQVLFRPAVPSDMCRLSLSKTMGFVVINTGCAACSTNESSEGRIILLLHYSYTSLFLYE
jgi:hypothetical protein